jgi:tetrahydromethanopterin:alpha-L-glutamate ligase
MKQIGIAVTDPGDWTAVALNDALVKARARPVVFRLHDVTTSIQEHNRLYTYSGDTDLESLDAVIVRDVGGSSGSGASGDSSSGDSGDSGDSSNGSSGGGSSGGGSSGGGSSSGGSEDMPYRLDVLCNLERSGLKVVNPPEAIRTAANKHMCSYLFREHGLPTPDTILTTDLDAALAAIRDWGRAVVKPIYGFKGMDIHCVVDDEHSVKLLGSVIDTRGVLYLQRFISNPGRDIRVFVIDGDVPAAIYRVAPPGSWINNLSRGGSHKRCEVTGEIAGLAIDAAQAVGAVYAGVDLIEGEDGLQILEVNGTPSGRGIYEACGVNMAQDIVKCVLDMV